MESKPPTQSPGIALEYIHLLSCSFRMLKGVKESKLNFHVGITDLQRATSEDARLLTVIVAFDLMKGVANPPCEFRCQFAAIYSRPAEAPMKWEDLRDHMLVAHMIPYVREFVSNVTTRAPLPALIIPPINIYELLEEYQQLSFQTAEQAQANQPQAQPKSE